MTYGEGASSAFTQSISRKTGTMSEDTKQISYLEILQEATDERDDLVAFANQHVSELIAPLVDALNVYLDLPRGYVEITGCSADSENVVMIGSINTQAGDRIADAYFGLPAHLLGDGDAPPPIEEIVAFMKKVDNDREIPQRDNIIDLIKEAELKLYYDDVPSSIPSVTEMHYPSWGETITEYNLRNLSGSMRTLH